VVELAHIRRDLLLSQARLRLTQAAGGLEGSLPAGPGRRNVDSKIISFIKIQNIGKVPMH
jgi:hypothetical protein